MFHYLPQLIRQLYSCSRNITPAIEDDKHRLLVLLALMTKLSHLRGYGSSALPRPVREHLNDARRQILDRIDCFDQSPAIVARSHTIIEMTRAIHLVKLVHMAHLNAAGDLMGFLYPVLRNGTESERARARMFDWAAEDARRYRQVVFSSAQVLSLLRQFPSDTPSEPFLIFHAGVILSCMAQIPRNEDDLEPGEVVRIDSLHGQSHQTQIADWLAHGSCSVAMHGVPSLFCSEGRRQILDQTAELLKRRTVWRISESLAQVVIALRNEGYNL